MIQQLGSFFHLTTDHTSYCFQITPQGFPQHLHYGKRLDLTAGYQPLVPQLFPWSGSAGNFPDGGYLETISLECSAPGLGDLRDPFAIIRTVDGDILANFRFQSAEILTEKPALPGLPSAYDEAGQCQTLCVSLTDPRARLQLDLLYTTFDSCDVITRSARLTNLGTAPVDVLRLMSSQLDFDSQDFIMTTFNGSWAREFEPTETPCGPGTIVSASRTGTSSNRANPFFFLRRRNTDEDHGDCYGFNLIYSGNHYASASGSPLDKLRVVQGIQPEGFRWRLEGGESFTAPEAALTYGWGLGNMSRNFHRFIREHILRGYWKSRPRPVLVNSWESFYFNFTEDDLVRLARQGKELGAELFVLDDGWFGKRDSDDCSLGDWAIVDRRKLPNGLRGLSDRLRETGIGFGLWVEPEMISEDSELYRAHPDWILGRKEQVIGRQQYVLDMARSEVQDYLIDTLTQVFEEGRPSYIKWDMNRGLTDTYSAALPPDRQGEVLHRYVLGLYRVLDVLTRRFPEILFENCSSGGNRTDLGMLSYMPQTWLSDNSDALCRCRMQYNASFGYPQTIMGAHVSSVPNHQVLRMTPLDSRFHVAAFGLLGYECDLSVLPAREKERIAEQIAFYKKYRETLQYGQLYRLRNGADGFWQTMAVSPDRKTALTMIFQPENRPNAPALRLSAAGLNPDAAYTLTVRPMVLSPGESGRPENGELHSEPEHITAAGSVFMTCGAWMKPGFSGTGWNAEIRVMGDCGSRMYLFEQET